MNNIADSRLNSQTIAAETAETTIREIVKNAYLRGYNKERTEREVIKTINAAVRDISIPRLKNAVMRSLWAFANRQLRIWRSLERQKIAVFLALLAYGENKSGAAAKTLTENAFIIKGGNVIPPLNLGGGTFISSANVYGVPINRYTLEYEKQYVTPVIERLVKDKAYDPDDLTGRNTLRNRAEMEVRYNEHLKSIDNFRKNGVRLVIASSHTDASDRCRPWQGRIFSLDRSSGKTDDGREFVPLETATDVYYTTKAGITYKNGLLGFNCRHFLIPYKSGLKLPKWTAREERKQYEITKKQREYERNIRSLKIKAVTEIKPQTAKAYKAQAKRLYNEYVDFSRRNKRAFYPARTNI